MGGGKLPPRQKMIGMMYLVLTALLAMNVSKDILNAFVIVNEGLSETSENFGKKNEKTYNDFKAAKEKDAAKVTPYYERAEKVKKLSADLTKYIQDLKVHLIMETDKCPEDSAKRWAVNLMAVNSKDNYDIPTHVLIGEGLENPKPASEKNSAAELEKKINDYRADLVKLFDDQKLFLPTDKKEIDGKIGLHLEGGMENGVKTTWAGLNFYHLPLAAVVTNLTKVQADIKNAEADCVTKLLSAVKGKDFTFDKLVAKVIAPSSYIIQGDEYKANVLLVAYNSTQNPEIIIGNVDTTNANEEVDPMKGAAGEKLPVESGMGSFKRSAGAEGIQKWGGCIKVEKPGGGFKYYPFQAEYMVAKPAVSVSPDKMNVFYIGVPNPVTVSAAGIPAENMSVSMTGGSISVDKRTGKGTVTVSAGTEATINVGAKVGAANKNLGSAKFRVKRLPDPVGYLGGMKGDAVIKKGMLIASGAVIAKMENFDFDLKVSVQSCDVTLSVKGDLLTIPCPGGNLAPALSQLQGLRNNQKVYIENVKARLPDGSVRTIPGLNLKVQL